MTVGAAAMVLRFGAADACVARLLCDEHPPDDVAFTVVEPDLSARELTYGELGRESARFAAALADLGVAPGDRVAVLMGRSIEHIVTLVGIWRRGAVLVPLSTALGRPGIAARLRAADVALVVVDADRRTKLAAGEGVPADPRWRVVVVGGEPGRRELSFEALMALYPDDPPAPVAVGGDGALLHVFTAGTTGPPKAVPVPVRALAAFAVARLATGDGPDEVHWDTADPGWATGLYSAVLGPLATGRRGLLTRGSLVPAPAWRLLVHYGVTHLHAGPTHFRTMAAAVPPPPGLVLRYASSTGEPLPPDLVTWAEKVFGHPLHDRYGQAELGTVLLDDPGCGPGTTGRPLPGWSVAVLSDDGDRPAPPGTVGRLAVERDASPLMWFTGYAGDPERTAASFTRDGRWYLTGDTAVADAAGCHRFSARTGDVIFTAGHRIAPFEVESVLMLHDDVVEAVVVGVPTARRGTVPEAYVVLRPGAEAVFGLADDLKRTVRAKLPGYAVPAVVHVVDALPRTPGGTVRRAALRERRANW